jgi:hypothetical protein
MGTDFAEKTPRVGAKTVLKKFDDIDLTDEQLTATEYFQELDKLQMSDLKINNNHLDKEQYKEDIYINSKELIPLENVDVLIQWLVDVKSFNKERMESRFNKALNKIEKKNKKDSKHKEPKAKEPKAKEPKKKDIETISEELNQYSSNDESILNKRSKVKQVEKPSKSKSSKSKSGKSKSSKSTKLGGSKSVNIDEIVDLSD